MAIQSVSGNIDSATGLRDNLKELNKLTSKYSDSLSEIKKVVNNLSSKELKGCSGCEKKLSYVDTDAGGKKFNIYYHSAAGVEFLTDSLSGVLSTVNALQSYIDEFKDAYANLDDTSDILEDLAYYIKKYQKRINKALSDDEIKTAAVMGMADKLASNKYDAKSRKFIPKDKVSTALDVWDGDLKFERQDNGTYLVIKVGKDGSEVPMGYTTKKGKNKYYKAAKEKVLEDLKKNNTSSKEETASSNEETTSSNEKNIASNSNSKSDSNSGDYVSASDIRKSIKRPIMNTLSSGVYNDLTSDEKMQVSRKVAADLKKQPYTKADLKGCNYSYETTIKDDKKFVRVKVSKYVVNTDAINKAPELKTLMNKEYDL